eukprot:5100875-Lingulodinium_polyedra.AAC.1
MGEWAEKLFEVFLHGQVMEFKLDDVDGATVVIMRVEGIVIEKKFITMLAKSPKQSWARLGQSLLRASGAQHAHVLVTVRY